MEPDGLFSKVIRFSRAFQSTGSVWSPTTAITLDAINELISIHGLRVEPDIKCRDASGSRNISIHGLRVEPDSETALGCTAHDISIHGLRVEPDRLI